MKIRYYLRGLGLGILFSAGFFLLGDNSGQTMSDEMIKERARELGMIESTILADMGTSIEETETFESEANSAVENSVEMDTSEMETMSEGMTTTEDDTEEALSEEETTSIEEITEENFESMEEEQMQEENSQEMEEDTSEKNEEVSSDEALNDEELIRVVVDKGDGSDTVSQKLYEAKLIVDPYVFDRYLIKNGYDRKIVADEHMIPMGSGWKEIAECLCS